MQTQLEKEIEELQGERQKTKDKYLVDRTDRLRFKPTTGDYRGVNFDYRSEHAIHFHKEGSVPKSKILQKLHAIPQNIRDDWGYTKEMIRWKTKLMKIEHTKNCENLTHLENKLLTEAGQEELKRKWAKQKLAWEKSRKAFRDELKKSVLSKRNSLKKVANKGKSLKRKLTRADMNLKGDWAKLGTAWFLALDDSDPEIEDMSWDQFWVEYKSIMRETMKEQKALQEKATEIAEHQLRIAPNRTIHYDSETMQRHITGTDPMDYVYREMLIYMEAGFDSVIKSRPGINNTCPGPHDYDTPEKRLLYFSDMSNTIKRNIKNIPIDNLRQIPDQGILVRWYVAHTLNRDKLGKLIYKTNTNKGKTDSDSVAQSSKSKRMKLLDEEIVNAVDEEDEWYMTSQEWVDEDFSNYADESEKEMKFQKRKLGRKPERNVKRHLAVRPSVYNASISKWGTLANRENFCDAEADLVAYARFPFILGMNQNEGKSIDKNEYFYYHRVGKDPVQLFMMRRAVDSAIGKEETKKCVTEFQVFANDLKEISNISNNFLEDQEAQAAALKNYINNHKYLKSSQSQVFDFQWVGKLIADKGADMMNMFFAEVRSGMTVYDWPTWSLLHYNSTTDSGMLAQKSLQHMDNIMSSCQFQQLDPSSTSYAYVDSVKYIGKEVWGARMKANTNKRQKTQK